MRRIHIVSVAAVGLVALVLAYSQSPRRITQTRPTPTVQTVTIERAASTQQRVNRYFHGDILPKLKSCWSTVKGKGRISLKYTYTKKSDRWVLARLDTQRSTLPTGQDAVAQKCMLEAVRGSSFTVEPDENKLNTFVLNWTWPIPFPANAAQLTRSMFAAKPTGSGSGGGCDGWGTEPTCMACKPSCDVVCVGYSSCGGDETQTTCDGKCASGGPFGVTGGGLVLY